MVHWGWLVAAFVVGSIVGEMSSQKYQKGFFTGVLAMILGILWF